MIDVECIDEECIDEIVNNLILADLDDEIINNSPVPSIPKPQSIQVPQYTNNSKYSPNYTQVSQPNSEINTDINTYITTNDNVLIPNNIWITIIYKFNGHF
eukprot:TRINITY_DN6681_c0_g1_i1.p1 TRINITY_DN6681_c0_g1~~TRINITY_DN6681_c0_g1_i1.p1  ORF type:complete len:101 (-),score=23.48 TRINITY_DN6681_c0_g1_i1:670-972(-)